MEYEDFYDIADCLNETYKGNYTEKEVACNAYTYLCEYNVGKITETMKTIVSLLVEDGSYQCREWALKIMEVWK